ncbi:GspH/FimT family pseudopilin [Desulfobacterium sp. N47]|uniref:Type II secretion system protein H n=1 Tax=uncultured Desulfobacterium sp. TaxID=201089 RepID=E1Y8V4_9BACT|nr:hypothetical protein N47_A10270 [uncultured Desulfobacterium sp.]
MQKKAGFSMIELMIVLGIIALLSAIITPNILSWLRNQGLRSAVSELQGNLQLAKLSAIRQNQSCDVNFDIVNGSYTIPCANKTVLLSSYSGGVVFGGPGAGDITDNTITFKSNGNSNSAAPLSIFLTDNKRSSYYRINVNLSGGVITSKWNGAIWK